ncbi:MAG: hypothetical protein QM680_06615 [Luteolibacter sp.]
MMVGQERKWFSITDWQEKSALHREQAERFTCGARERKDRGVPHPIEDFLFQYYPFPLSLLEVWQPGIGVGLEWRSGMESEVKFTLKYYCEENGVLFADAAKLSDKERHRYHWILELLSATAGRPGNFSCHGLHEWAMVYRGKEVRHEKTTPLRLKQAEIDAVVESRTILCSHHDAFRFFADEARPMNRLQPTLDRRVELEQPGCVHANMDLYKWTAKSMPWAGTELLWETFMLAMKLRDLDMRASPYDLRAWGRQPVRIETVEGRREYEREQRVLALDAEKLRARLIGVLVAVLANDEGKFEIKNLI